MKRILIYGFNGYMGTTMIVGGVKGLWEVLHKDNSGYQWRTKSMFIFFAGVTYPLMFLLDVNQKYRCVSHEVVEFKKRICFPW